MPQGKSLQELKGRKGVIIDKPQEKVEGVDQDKESKDIEDDHNRKKFTQIVVELCACVSKINKDSSIKDTQEVGENNMINIVNKVTT